VEALPRKGELPGETGKPILPMTTIRDIARLAGVSTAIVSNVVNQTGSFGCATKQRVEATIRITNWRPNVNAQQLGRNAAKKQLRSRAELFQSRAVRASTTKPQLAATTARGIRSGC
jgi:DNA-binding LacI/PurR family transcriptional regulator